MSRLGGFTFGIFIICWLLMYAWNYFNSNSMLLHTMIHFAGAQNVNADPRAASAQVIRDRREFSYWFAHWLFCCLCKDKRVIWKTARDQMDKELDLVNIVNSTRKSAYLTKLEKDGAHIPLCNFGIDYRVEQECEGIDCKEANEDDVNAAKNLNPDS